MPRVVCFGFPARGHTVPGLPVIAELIDRGIAVDYYSTPVFQTLIETAGARFVTYPPSCEARLSGALDSEELLARSLAATLEMLPDLLAALEEARPDLVMFDASSLWGGLVARRLEIPCIASITTFAMNRPMLRMIGAAKPSAWSDPIVARLNDEYDAGFRDHLDLLVPIADLKLVYTTRLFQPAGKFFDASHLFVGPLLDRRPRHGERVEADGSRRLAYVSLGTIFNRDHALLRRVSGDLAARGWQVIVSLGGGAVEHEQPWPEHVRAHGFVDQMDLLAQARLFVTHGGMNSVSEALVQAVPMIVIPQAVDQHLVARHTANLGAAVVVEREALAAGGFAAALARIEGNRASFEAAAARLRQGFSEIVPLAGAIDQALALMKRGRTDA